MAIANTLKDYLNSRGIAYEVITHDPTATSTQTVRAAHIPAECLAKSVVLEDEAGFLMAVVPSNRRVRLGQLSANLHRHLRLASEHELAGLFRDCALGAVPPVGRAYGIETILDDELAHMRDVYFEAGDHEALIHMSGEQFAGLMSGIPRHFFARPLESR